MLTSCFFCQNLLSDALEGLLPPSREEELRSHLGECGACQTVERDLKSTLDLLHAIPPRPLGHELALRVSEASQAGRPRLFNRARVSRLVLALAVPALLFAGMIIAFPDLFPWFSRFPVATDDAQFVKYAPLAQGASEVIDEQASWLQVREPFMRSVWEEGGLSPEEFEKTFEIKPSLSGAAPVSSPAEGAPAESSDAGDE